MTVHIPENHPRAQAMHIRGQLVDAFEKGIVAQAGLFAHGRGECFDYLIGEQTTPIAQKAIDAACAAILLAKHPIISVNGNMVALVPQETVTLGKTANAPLEINLFYRTKAREDAILNLLSTYGATNVLGVGDDPTCSIEELQSARRIVSQKGIFSADLVFVPLEDGDRTEALVHMGKKVITIDLNPLSRTARMADITIVDNIIRALPLMITRLQKLSCLDEHKLNTIVTSFNNKENLIKMQHHISDRLRTLS